ncbi:peroxiredoxin [Pseudolysinimonas sp.]|jgi:peroxiredoxin Q/BCP|uniref:peroxiredoxin n=1 Tax=Pseudolysinimonas sp. TaxID=2680009 RepID=UPI003784A21F
MTDLVRLDAGELAPDFTLTDQHGKPFTLSSTRGSKTIVYFYGEAGTPACTSQACDFRDNMAVFEQAGYRVVGISRDEPEANAGFAADENLPQVILSDPTREVHGMYGTFGEKQLYGRTVTGVIRATFVLDEEGRILMPLYNIKATGHVAMLLKKLRLDR